MGRILFWLIIVFGAWFGLRLMLSKRQSDERRDDRQARSDEPLQIPMSQCAYCGVHFPSAERVTAKDGRGYCTRAHHDAALQGPSPDQRA
jgi:hypothetical protein